MGEFILEQSSSMKINKGATVWLTGLPCAGKSTIARLLKQQFEKWNLNHEVLDGDILRKNLCKDLGFSKRDRDENIRRVGFVCQLLTRNGILVLAAVISPYREARDFNRRLIGDFVEVYVKASVEVCEKRDNKGLYHKARSGAIKGFTGIDDPYEPPLSPEVICETENETPQESAQKVINKLKELGYLPINTSTLERVFL